MTEPALLFYFFFFFLTATGNLVTYMILNSAKLKEKKKESRFLEITDLYLYILKLANTCYFGHDCNGLPLCMIQVQGYQL